MHHDICPPPHSCECYLDVKVSVAKVVNQLRVLLAHVELEVGEQLQVLHQEGPQLRSEGLTLKFYTIELWNLETDSGK